MEVSVNVHNSISVSSVLCSYACRGGKIFFKPEEQVGSFQCTLQLYSGYLMSYISMYLKYANMCAQYAVMHTQHANFKVLSKNM